MYMLLKHLHVTCVALSGFGFCVRAYWMLGQSPRLREPWVKLWPHAVDTVLLGSALSMAILSSQYPFVQTWLTAKLFGLLTYIGCGTMALKRGKTREIRRIFLAFALAAYGYIVCVALTKTPFPMI